MFEVNINSNLRMGYNKEELIYLARLAEQCERYDGEWGVTNRDGEEC